MPSHKLAVALAAAAVCLVQLRPADACSPAPNCGNTYCYQSPDALVSGQLVGRQTSTSPPTVTIEIASVHGDAGSLAAGMVAEIEAEAWHFEQSDVGRTLHVLVRRFDAQSPLAVVQRIDPQEPFAADCFGADAPAAAVADIVLSPACFDTLEPDWEDPCAGACSAGGGHGTVWAALALGLVGLRRRRRG